MANFILPDVLDQRGAQNVSQQLIALVGQPLVIDASALRRLGAVGLEMLIATQRQWREDGANFHIQDWSPESLDMLMRLGSGPTAFQREELG